MSACASAFSHQRCVHACTVLAAGRNRILELSELCVASLPSRAPLSSDRLNSSLELAQLSFVDFEKKKRKKLLQTSLRRAQERPRQMSELEVVDLSLWKSYEHRSSTSTKLVAVQKRQAVSRCFQHEGESPRSRKGATLFV